MSNPGNLPSKQNKNATTEFFNNYFTEKLTTSSNVNDAVLGYFETITGNKDAAKVLADSVLYTALNQGLDPMSVIDEFRKLPPKELNAYLTMFLNFNRVDTSLLGISNQPQTNKYIQRAILP